MPSTGHKDGSYGEITLLLRRLRTGEENAGQELFPLIYSELKRIAAAGLRREVKLKNWEATSLANEAYVRLVGTGNTAWQDRVHFFAVAAHVVRHVLVDRARAGSALRRGGGLQKVDFEEALRFAEVKDEDLLALHEALDRLAGWAPRQSRVVEMRFFGGMTEEEIAESLQTSLRTVKEHTKNAQGIAKAWRGRF